MMRASEGTGVLTRFGALRRRMSMRRTVTTIVFSLAVLMILASCGGRVRYPNCLRRRIRLLQKTCTPRWQSVNFGRPPT